jgi:hypothetical protein
MYIFPLVELLQVALNPNPIVSIGFQEEIIIDGKREEDVVLQIARRDMPKGAGVFSGEHGETGWVLLCFV